jgi:hypothetical protein
MKNIATLLLIILLAAMAAGCASFSKYAIDEKPTIKIDTALCGIWKLIEDKYPQRFLILQHSGQYLAQILSVSDSERNSTAEQFGIQFEKLMERNRQIEIAHFSHLAGYGYMLACSNEIGNAIAYSKFTITLSSVGKWQFLNIPCHDIVYDTTDVKLASLKYAGSFYCFAKLLYLSKTKDTFAIAMVKDKQLLYAESNSEVRRIITTNIDNPHFYSDTLHFYKVSDYHASIHEAWKYANPK